MAAGGERKGEPLMALPIEPAAAGDGESDVIDDEDAVGGGDGIAAPLRGAAGRDNDDHKDVPQLPLPPFHVMMRIVHPLRGG